MAILKYLCDDLQDLIDKLSGAISFDASHIRNISFDCRSLMGACQKLEHFLNQFNALNRRFRSTSANQHTTAGELSRINGLMSMCLRRLSNISHILAHLLENWNGDNRVAPETVFIPMSRLDHSNTTSETFSSYHGHFFYLKSLLTRLNPDTSVSSLVDQKIATVFGRNFLVKDLIDILENKSRSQSVLKLVEALRMWMEGLNIGEIHSNVDMISEKFSERLCSFGFFENQWIVFISSLVKPILLASVNANGPEFYLELLNAINSVLSNVDFMKSNAEFVYFVLDTYHCYMFRYLIRYTLLVNH